MKDWPKLILALDVPMEEMEGVLTDVGSLVRCYKVGLNMIASNHLQEVVRMIHRRGGSLFFDGKLHDIPNTVANAARSLVDLGARYFTVHASGGKAMMKWTTAAATRITETPGTTVVPARSSLFLSSRRPPAAWPVRTAPRMAMRVPAISR